MRMLWVIAAIVSLALATGWDPAIADSRGKFPGKGDPEAYNRSVDVAIKAIDLGKQGDYIKAIELYRQAISIYPYDSAWHHNIGNALEKVGKLEEATKEQKEAIALEPNMLAAWLSLGLEYEKQKKFKDAENCYRKSVQIKPDSYEAVFNLGDILRQQSRFTEAKGFLLKAKSCPLHSIAPPGEVEKAIDQCNRKDASN